MKGGNILWSLVVKGCKKAGCGIEPYKNKIRRYITLEHTNHQRKKHLSLPAEEGPLELGNLVRHSHQVYIETSIISSLGN